MPNPPQASARTITPRLMSVARGDEPADLAITNARVVDVFNRRITDPTSIYIADRLIAAVTPDRRDAKQTIDAKGAYCAPGLIDAHMHVESTMLPPSRFVSLALPHATTGAVFDPHEIANVLGIEGIRYLMQDAEGLPFHAMWGASSCVPSCPLETAGAELSASDLAPLFDDPRVVALAEMMNFPGVFLGLDFVLDKVNLGLARRLVDGHAPGLTGANLQAYAAAGISSDHECTTLSEAREKLALGMRIFIREGSAARNLEALFPIITPETAHLISFCTDDRHPADLREVGHIDNIVRQSIAMGLDAPTAFMIASYNTAMHYRRPDLGAITPSRWADLCLFDDPQNFNPHTVLCKGQLVAQGGNYTGPSKDLAPYPKAPVTLPSDLSESSLRIKVSSASAQVRVIGMDPHQLVTEHLVESPTIDNACAVSDTDRDILKIAVIERHKGTGNIGLGFIKGFKLRSGAIASTVGHDAHNLAVVGTNDRDMLAAARAVAEIGGGQSVACDGETKAVLPLPIAGLMSDQPAQTVINQQAKLLEAARALGCPHHDPFMPLSFMPLPVIPSLKLSDLGLVDVEKFEIVPLEVN